MTKKLPTLTAIALVLGVSLSAAVIDASAHSTRAAEPTWVNQSKGEAFKRIARICGNDQSCVTSWGNWFTSWADYINTLDPSSSEWNVINACVGASVNAEGVLDMIDTLQCAQQGLS